MQGSKATADQQNTHSSKNLEPRLLLFSIGPVQDFIAAARSTRDLWSGSYLLSWLVSHALGKIANEIGPDQVIFPNLLDQPLIDLQFKDDVFSKVTFSQETVWKALDFTGKNLPKLLTPSLPNRFMALLPARHPETGESIEGYAARLAESVKHELEKIADSVKKFLKDNRDPAVCEFDPEAFDRQVGRMLEIQWQTLAIPKTLAELQATAEALLPPDDKDVNYTPRAAVDAILKMAKIKVPETTPCKPQYEINNYAGWSLLNALIAYLHDGVKATRAFDAWRGGRWESGKAFNKDALNGKEEAVLRVDPSDTAAERYGSRVLGLSKGTLKPGELLGASTLIKRFWHYTFLPGKLGIDNLKLRQAHPMPNTHAVAGGQPFRDDDEESEGREHSDKYFAILALDGDEMGKWMSGSKSPSNRELLSPLAVEFYQKHAPDFLNAPRAVTPSWHLQFAEALGNSPSKPCSASWRPLTADSFTRAATTCWPCCPPRMRSAAPGRSAPPSAAPSAGKSASMISRKESSGVRGRTANPTARKRQYSTSSTKDSSSFTKNPEQRRALTPACFQILLNSPPSFPVPARMSPSASPSPTSKLPCRTWSRLHRPPRNVPNDPPKTAVLAEERSR